ncbi:amidase family protein [Actinidia rufa]|uniref:Amidase family protein n=1 Tax=Actinidia rufa TaxID=165716 RepID=A0A7J0DYP7_9ERIC|nr:amidase family protein [Actinidia rufa]
MLSSVPNPRFLLLHLPPKHLHFPTTKALHTSQTLALSLSLPLTSRLPNPHPPPLPPLTPKHSRTEPHLKSFLHVSENALKEAAEIDRRIERNEAVGLMAGVLVAVKDNICTADMPSSVGLRALEGYRPLFDATAVMKLRERGAIVIGKTNMDEFGMGSTTEGSAYQLDPISLSLSHFTICYHRVKLLNHILELLHRPVKWKRRGNAFVLASSSCNGNRGDSDKRGDSEPLGFVKGARRVIGGSAAAVSARQCVVSLESDTGGSVRQPASFCGVVGLKPTYGRVSRYGLVVYASSLDVIGCFGSSVTDTGILLMQFLEMIDLMPILASDYGFSFHILNIRHGNQVVAEQLNSLYGDSCAKGFGSEVKMRILMGTYSLSAGYYDAYYKRAHQELFGFLLPQLHCGDCTGGEKKNDPLAMYAGDTKTVNVNLAGLPALVLPCGFVEGESVSLSVGFQMIGAAFDENDLCYL